MSEVRSEDDGRMNGLCFVHYAGRAGTGFTETELKRLAGVLQPLEVQRMPLDKPPPRETRFGSPLELSRVHWMRLPSKKLAARANEPRSRPTAPKRRYPQQRGDVTEAAPITVAMTVTS